MTGRSSVFIMMLLASFFSVKAMAQPGCLLSFNSTAYQYKKDGKIIPGSYADKVVKDCAPVFQSICSDPKSKTQIIVPAPYQYGNANAPKINSTDVDNFCKAIMPK
jgi:hypothetical protein